MEWVNLTQMTIISTNMGMNSLEEMEENNRMGKTRYLFKKIRDTKEIFHAKMGTIKEKSGMDLIKTEDIKEEVARIHRRTIQKGST